MEMKNDCQLDYIKEAFDKLYSSVMPYIDWTQFADADTAFKELDRKVHSEIYILKKCLAERDRAVEAGLTRSKVDRERISELENELAQARNSTELLLRKENDRLRIVIDELEKENASLRVTVTPFDILESLKKENSELKTRNERLNTKRKSNLKDLFEARIEAAQYKKNNVRQRADIDTLEKEINALKKKIHELKTRNEILEKSNSILRRDNETLWSRLEECDIPKREQASYKSLVEAIEFQNKKIEELEAEKAMLKEAYDIHETTTKKENVDLSPGHEFEFGDEVFVPWSDGPYMYVKTGLLYNTRTKRLVYVGKDQHLKWFGEKFAIV